MQIDLTMAYLLQSPYLFLQAAGSLGKDGSVPGIHLRWDLLRNLGNSHLPKGDYAKTTNSFNRSVDYVHLYRSSYETQYPIFINFETGRPTIVHDNRHFWVYHSYGRALYVHFRDTALYDSIRVQIDPRLNPASFVKAYDYRSGLFEIEVKGRLCFASEFRMAKEQGTPLLRVEALSVRENTPLTDRIVSLRKTFRERELCLNQPQQLLGSGAGSSKDGLPSGIFIDTKMCKVRVVAENIVSVRLRAENCRLHEIWFETYEDYLTGVNRDNAWIDLGDFALTNDTAAALQRLENPTRFKIHGNWHKFNSGSPVNVSSYQDRWNMIGGLKAGVETYIKLSDTDPKASATLHPQDPKQSPMQVSYLDMLRLVAADYHVARMLGLGHIDTDFAKTDQQAVYLAAYVTEGQLDDHGPKRMVKHLFITPPTSSKDERLPKVLGLEELRYGLFNDNGERFDDLVTDNNGYTFDSLSRIVTLFAEEEPLVPPAGAFFQPPDELSELEHTSSVFIGITYKALDEPGWRRPELSFDTRYQDAGVPPAFETRPIPYHGQAKRPAFVHRETEEGVHMYSSYGINWFFRTSGISPTPLLTDHTRFRRQNSLLAPSDFHAHLIQEEDPVLLTTSMEQSMLAALTGSKVLIRVTFQYNHIHDQAYSFADRVEFLFREELAQSTTGKIDSVIDDPADQTLAVVRTGTSAYNSNNSTMIPIIEQRLEGNYVGGILAAADKRFVIEAVRSLGPEFTVRKIRNRSAVPLSDGRFEVVDTWDGPPENVSFLAIENVSESNSWPGTNPLSSTVQIGDQTWTMRVENFVDDGVQRQVRLRGVWDTASISVLPDQQTGNPIGVYQIIFDNYILNHHPQHQDTDPVEWYKGAARIPRNNNPSGPRKDLEVLQIEHIGDGQKLRLVVFDETFMSDPIRTGQGILVNFYPGYKVYLHADTARGLTDTNLLPSFGSRQKRTLLSCRSVDTGKAFRSRIGIPAVLLGQRFIDPIPPEIPMGGPFASRPDFFRKSTYSLQLQFVHKPFAVAVYRASDDAILRSLYEEATVQQIKGDLKALGEDPFHVNRWRNLVGFDYIYDQAGRPFYDAAGANPNGSFRRFPAGSDGYRFPRPDKAPQFDGMLEPGQMVEQVRAAVYAAFIPLTEQPLIYDHIKGGDYQPVNKKQTVRDRHGVRLEPSHPDFDQAPMARRIGPNQIQFTDFTLDGASSNQYFYCAREIGDRMKIGEPSPIFGPIRLLNTAAPQAPKIRRIWSQTASVTINRPAAVHFEINAYPENQKIERIQIYRAARAEEALSIRNMTLAKTFDLAGSGQLGEASWHCFDDFEGMRVLPFGQTLFYRLAVLRKIINEQDEQEFISSKPSQLLLANIVDDTHPHPPTLTYTSFGFNPLTRASLPNVTLVWNRTTHNGVYYLQKQDGRGFWQEIYKINSDEDTIRVPLSNTALGTGLLYKEDINGNELFHRFRVRVQNSSGLFNQWERESVI